VADGGEIDSAECREQDTGDDGKRRGYCGRTYRSQGVRDDTTPIGRSGRSALKYQSGEEIQKGDKVLFHGEAGEIEFVVDRLTGDPATDWYMKELGPGAMVVEPKHFGSAYIRDTEANEDLLLVSRRAGK
jgi:hypothetical protein